MDIERANLQRGQLQARCACIAGEETHLAPKLRARQAGQPLLERRCRAEQPETRAGAILEDRASAAPDPRGRYLATRSSWHQQSLALMGLAKPRPRAPPSKRLVLRRTAWRPYRRRPWPCRRPGSASSRTR